VRRCYVPSKKTARRREAAATIAETVVTAGTNTTMIVHDVMIMGVMTIDVMIMGVMTIDVMITDMMTDATESGRLKY
jgi:hypothetical protein